MIRQAHAYLAGAVSGTALIGAAVVTFVMLVSLQALRDWPLAGIGDGGGSAAVSAGQTGSGTENATNGAGGAVTAHAAGNGANGAGRHHRGADSLGAQRGGAAAGGASPVPPTGESPSSGSNAEAGSAPSPSSTGGGGGGSGPGSGGGGGGGGGNDPGQSTSGAIAGTVNETVSGVDQATGGALGSTGVTKVTEEVVNGVAGPESTVGKTVDGAVESVGGLLGGHK